LGKIFDALEKSKEESQELSAVSVVSGGTPVGTPGGTPRDKIEKSTGPAESIAEQTQYNDIDRNLVTLLQPQSMEAEQFKMLKTNLLFPASGKPPRIIMVTSALPGEGKSFVAANMAISIAQNIDEHVLLMDCDLRLPVMHKRFGLGEKPGLSEYLSKDIPLPSLLCKTEISKLSILPGGTPPPNPAELLSSGRMSNLIKELKHKYNDRIIIIDTAPPQLTAEGSALSKLVDGIIIVIRYGSTKRKLIKGLVDLLGKKRVLGVIMNRFDMISSSYYGLGKHNKYSQYYGKR
jgi:protein-tyrosine kinase